MNIKYKFFISLLILCVLFTITSVSALDDNQTDVSSAIDDDHDEVLSAGEDWHSFKELNKSISDSAGELNLTYDYRYGGEYESVIIIMKSEDYTLNGNGHIIDGIDQEDVFSIESEKTVTINNLTFANCINTTFNCYSPITFNNVRFIGCSGYDETVFMSFSKNANVTFNNCVFQMKSGVYDIMWTDQTLTFNNSIIKGGKFAKSAIFVDRGSLIIENTTFANISSLSGVAINYKGWNLTIKRSKFLNLDALSAGAIIGKFFPKQDKDDNIHPNDPFLIEECEFANLTAINNAGALYFDLDSGSNHVKQSLNIFGCTFTNCKALLGGAIMDQGGILNIENSTFEDNFASFEGGAIYTTWAKLNMVNVTLFNNTAEKNAGAIYFDKGNLTIKQSYLIANKVSKQSDDIANVVYAHDVGLYFSNSTFDNGGISVYADFAGESKIENVTRNADIFSLNNTNYIVSVESNGIKLHFVNNTIVYDEIPSNFSLYDYGWVSPEKIQGDNDDCWAFATVGSIESALLRTTGILYNLSQNYVQKLQLKYVPNGDLRISLTGFAYSGLGYALSWYGVLPMDMPYDARGMIADTDFDDARIHVQDAMFIYGQKDDTVDLIKEAVLKYGPVTVQILLSNAPVPTLNTTGDDIAVMEHNIHFVSIVGWDDNYTDNEDSDERGAFICKDSIRGFYDHVAYNFSTLLAADYYAIVPQNAGICYIFNNDIDYHVNYQTDLTGLTGFDGNYTHYSNVFTSKYDEWIGAVGTYFNESGIDYSLDVYVNGARVHSQSGTSEFAGFRTIVLKRYIPVKEGDEFKVVFHSNAVPYQAYSRQHYMPNMTFVSADNETWSDITYQNRTVCLKVYTVTEDRKYYTFEELNQSIAESVNEITLEHDYIFDGTSLEFNKDVVFTINGNGHVLKGLIDTDSLAFISNNKLIVNNLTFEDCINSTFYVYSPVIFNNVTFVNCSGKDGGNFFYCENMTVFDNCIFHMAGGAYNVIFVEYNPMIIKNTIFSDCSFVRTIITDRGSLFVENTTFENINAIFGTAINFKGDNLTVRNSKFINLHANLSGGAIIAKYFPSYDENGTMIPMGPFLIEGCEFINTSSHRDGGALYSDLVTGSDDVIGKFNLFNNIFTNCTSQFGGAILNVGGIFNIVNATVKDCCATFEGGAIYTTWSDVNLINSTLLNNRGEKNAGAFYFDKGKLTIKQSYIINNKAMKEATDVANAIYAHDVEIFFLNSTFDNGGISVYADFASDSKLENVIKNEDIFLLDNKNYIVSVESNGMKLNLVNNTIIFNSLPPKFDLRDWGWVSPLKVQGDNDDCWAFATISSLESSLLKSTGVLYNLSENYVQILQLRYAANGDLKNKFTGFDYSGLGYALSWYGVLPADSPYDDRGLIGDTDLGDARIHVQDAMIIFANMSNTRDLIKQALIKYGSVTVHKTLDVEGHNVTIPDDLAIADHQVHFVSIIGWDDNYELEGHNGVWIYKDSLGDFAEMSYYDETLLNSDLYAVVPQAAAIAYIFENTIDYHVNYQTDITGLTGFDGNYTYYSNEFISKYSELIGAVGTYFNESGINYSFDIYVNGEKVHSQNGVSEFAGFRTIVLNSYVPVKEGDRFKVVFKSNALPYQAFSRTHYMSGMTFVSADGSSWSDFTLENKTVCLKVYTVADDSKVIENRDITVDYDGGSYFTVKVITADGRPVGAGAEVTFTINGVTTTVRTDNDGIARFLITETPNTYTITTSYKGLNFINTVVVKQVLTTSKVTVKKTAKRIVLKATLKINGKPVKGKTVRFTFRGKTYSAVTNANGVAQVNVPKSVMNKLKNNKNYAFSVTYLKDTISSTVKALDVIVLKAKKVTVKKTAKKFILKATLKINGKAAKGKKITFKFKGKTYKAKTNKRGIAKKVLKKNVIKKLKKGKTYKVKVTYLKTTKKTTVKVK